MQLPPISTRSNVFATCTPRRAAFQKGRLPVCSSLECGSHLGSILSSLLLPHPTHPLLLQLIIIFTEKTVLFLVKPVTGLLPSSSSDFGPFPSPALAVQVGSLPITNVRQWSLKESKEEPQLIAKRNHAFPFLDMWYGQSCPCSVWF